ncbi:hypothetical protein [Ornithinibacillus halotolerans]|uniref:Uncharacterized protein n=1 Tax=Ornithinibacillus halotolerans TaxID=1274357 RepID=A0A916S8Q8_9BACI|nr:hypothetical protein [Ornithinibacillus halotolerans]GGA90042.1 hypothetical protein GCM10008025_35790 [Ornithinibacillus halotolerans]
MKKYIIFAISFIVLFSLFHILFGMILTFIYTPDVSDVRNAGELSQEGVILGNNSNYLPNLIIAFLSASIAYVIPKKINK